MNKRFFTGWLPVDAERAYAPATAERAAAPRLVFEVTIKDSAGVEFPEKCFIDDARLIAAHADRLTAGAAVCIEGEQTARPWHDRGVLKGFVREVRVLGIDIPNRAGKPRKEEKADKAEVPANGSIGGHES